MTNRENIAKLSVTESLVSDSIPKEPAAGVKNDALKIGRRTALLVILVSLALVSLAFHKDIFGYSFVGSDIPTLVENSRIHGLDDVTRIFSDGKNAGTGSDVENPEGIYRPVSVLTYSMDYALWGLNPFGYHLTDFLLHLSAVFLVAYLTFRLTRSHAVSLLSGLIFTLHPIIIENLSASSRRQAILPAIFMLIALIFFIKYVESPEGRKTNLAASLAAYLLALGTHEIAIMLPALLFGYQVIFGPKHPWKKTVPVWVKTLAPFLIISLIFLAWRTVVLHGVGGYGVRPTAGGSYDVLSTEIVSAFFKDLFYPGDLISWLLSPLSPGSRLVLLIVLLIAASSVVLVYCWRMIGSFERRGEKERKVLISIYLTMLLACGVLIFFLIMNVQGHVNPLLLQILRGLTPIVIISLLLLLVGVDQRKRLKNFYQASAYGKVLLFAAIWTVLPLLIFLPSLTFNHRSMYISLVPFSVMVAVFLVEGMKTVKAMASGGKIPLANLGSSGVLKVVCLLLVLALALSFPLSTYLINRAGEWKADDNFTKLLFTRIKENIDSLPADSEIDFYNLPTAITYFDGEFPHAKQVTYPESYSIKSWIDLNRPDNHINVIRRESVALKECPADLNLRLEPVGDKEYKVNIDYRDGSCAAQ